jgi:hypothetical protein
MTLTFIFFSSLGAAYYDSATYDSATIAGSMRA